MSLPNRFPDREEIAAVREEADKLAPGAEADAEHRLAGRVMARRDLGKLVFLDVVDRSGRIQLLVRPDDVGGVDLDLGDIVGVEGVPAKSRRGEPSVAVRSLELLAKIRAPLPDTFHGVTDVEQRYRRRYLDLLVNADSRRLAATRARIVAEVRAYLDGEGFLEVETPILQPRYGGGFAEPFVTHYNVLDADYYLRIATELYLKRLIVGGLERVYELGKDFRNEGLSYKHQPEFTQVEWYEAYADYRDTMARMEELVDHALTAFVEPSLVEPTILYDYPVELSPFARPTEDDPSLVERFEFFVGGTELGNAFTEINDPEEQAARFAEQAAEAGGEPGDPDFVDALSYGMPPTGGLGMG